VVEPPSAIAVWFRIVAVFASLAVRERPVPGDNLLLDQAPLSTVVVSHIGA
jgi:hypothetical protein